MTIELIVVAGGLLLAGGFLKAQQDKKLKPKKVPVKADRKK